MSERIPSRPRREAFDVESSTFYYEKKLLAGWRWFWSKHQAIELVGGYAFDRYFVENNGFSFSLSGTNRVDVGSGPFVTLQFDYRF